MITHDSTAKKKSRNIKNVVFLFVFVERLEDINWHDYFHLSVALFFYTNRLTYFYSEMYKCFLFAELVDAKSLIIEEPANTKV